ncbi:T9SS type A sorting domain-containing protein [Spirosoma panaciterrae]|uniref:T9SS type A sorting domain-containing protein n=1 Tax=Spirosoma panaciterrae TaxID=496058 RepID=UPI0003A97420|nr:T9SS type A sorting domain-containing protein [Spirosoma panaciterrae]
MRTITFLCLMLSGISAVRATHLIGGYIQAKPVSGSSLTYEVTLVVYMNEVQGRQAADQADRYLICFGDGTSNTVTRQSRLFIANNSMSINTYRINHTYPGPNTYTLTTTISNRSIVQNITKADYQFFTLSTTVSTNVANQTPTPGYPPTGFRAGVNKKLLLDLKATDAEGDSLMYGLAKSLTSTDEKSCDKRLVPTYQFPNDVTRQGIFKLNSQTGELTWDSPTQVGLYSVVITIDEYRNGLLISQTTEELTITVDDLPGTSTPIPPYEPAILGNGSIVTNTVVYSDPDILFITFPNPVEGRMQVVIQTSNPTTASLQLTDVNGRKLHELLFSKASRQHEQVIGLDSLTPGIYLLRADVNGRSLLRKIVKR